ncbi:MAG: hypothetical protein KDA32_10845 [Phycisphaerales bacterium]|nr:hypothetical protein [Phycisphaerales bacterium]
MDPDLLDKLLSAALDDPRDPEAVKTLEAICAHCAMSRAHRDTWLRVQRLLRGLHSGAEQHAEVDWREFAGRVRAALGRQGRR